MAKIMRPEGIKVGKLGDVPDTKQDHSDGADDETDDLESVEGALELGDGHHDEEDDEHDQTGAELCGIVDDGVDHHATHLVDEHHGDADGGVSICC